MGIRTAKNMDLGQLREKYLDIKDAASYLPRSKERWNKMLQLQLKWQMSDSGMMNFKKSIDEENYGRGFSSKQFAFIRGECTTPYDTEKIIEALEEQSNLPEVETPYGAEVTVSLLVLLKSIDESLKTLIQLWSK